MLTADLHTHSTASDGAWSAEDVVRAAKAANVVLLSITDHDEVSSNVIAREHASRYGITYVSGIELSSQWRDEVIHVVGLNIDETNPAILAAVLRAQQMRLARAKAMGESFERIGITGVYEGALALASSPQRLSRTHFARYLVARGICSHTGEVFSRFMKPGKPGYVPTHWMNLPEAVHAIHAAGGDAVLAHPARYDLQWVGGIHSLLRDFKDSGGDAIEVVCAAHSPADWSVFGGHCRAYDFRASIGSDFHSPKESRHAIGDLPRMPSNLTPVWQDWNISHA